MFSFRFDSLKGNYGHEGVNNNHLAATRALQLFPAKLDDHLDKRVSLNALRTMADICCCRVRFCFRLRPFMMSCMVLFLAIFAALTVPRLMAFSTSDPFHGLSRLLGNHHEPKLGAVSSLSRECSHIGIQTLEHGGNAADAMIATEICLGVIGMHATGLGSGGFALIRAPNGSYDFVDFRPTAPAAAFETMFVNNEEASLWSGLASAVPGELRGLDYLHKTYARLPWRQLFLPSIRLARDGFVVSQDLVNIFHQEDDASFLTDNPAWAMDFSPNGTWVKAGDVMTRKRYAKLLEVVSKEGADAFYTGRVAEATIATIRAANGTMSLEDLRDYKIVRRKPLDITYRGFKITLCGAPSSGSVILSVMKTIEGYSDMCNPKSINMSSHHLAEAMRFGYGARTQLGDPSFIHNATAFQLEMIKESTASKIRSKISDSSTLPISAYNPAGIEVLETPSTSHVSTADASGMAIALTSTVNLYFGSKVMVPETGLIMNNLVNDFSTPGQTDVFGFVPSPANFIVPGKRPLSAMSPTIIEKLSDSSLYYVLGGAGGSHIITAIIQCLWNMLDRNMTVPEALLSPRFHDQLIPNETEFEPNFDNSTIAFMASRGHNITYSERQSDIEALRRLPNGTFEAGGDPSLLNSGGFAI